MALNHTLAGFQGYMDTYAANAVSTPATAYQAIVNAIGVRVCLPDESTGPTGQTVKLVNIETLRTLLADLEERVALAEESDASVTDRKRIIKSRISYGG